MPQIGTYTQPFIPTVPVFTLITLVLENISNDEQLIFIPKLVQGIK